MEREGCAKPVQPHSPRLGRSYASWSAAEAHVRPRGGAYNCLPTQGEHTKQYLKGLLAELQNATAAISFRAGEPKPTDPVVLARREVQQAVTRATSPRTPFKIGVDVRQPTLKERAAGFYVRGAVTRTEQILLLRKQIEEGRRCRRYEVVLPPRPMRASYGYAVQTCTTWKANVCR